MSRPHAAGCACRLCQLWERDASYRRHFDAVAVPVRRAAPAPNVPARRRPLPCVHLDEQVIQACPQGDPFRDTHECDFGHGIVSRAAVCEYCADYTLPEPVPELSPAASVGVAVGTYGLPGLAELQVRLLRHHNPGVPILIADDGSPSAAILEALSDRYPDVTVWVSPQRRGHYAGDLSVFWKAVQWARGRKFLHVAKVSQRCLVDRPGWLAEACRLLANSGAAVASQDCRDNGVRLYVRSELTALDVASWAAVLGELDRHDLRNATELHLNHLLVHRLGNRMAKIPWLTADRYVRSEGVVWHCSHTHAEFAALAARFGLTLDADFTTDGWQRRPGWLRG